MLSYGARREFIFKIFFFEGLLIAGKGIFIGAIVGYGVCFLQIYFNVVTMPNSGSEAFPMSVSFSDGIMILSLASVLSAVFIFLPVKYLIRKNIKG
jgi:lipoprotein-releasing system permease protein